MTPTKSARFPIPLKKKIPAYLLKGGEYLLRPLSMVGNFAARSINHLNNLQFQLTCPVGADDIFIATFPKSGTTWMQMILYQLTTDGSMKFEHILQKSPFWETILPGHWRQSPLQFAHRRIFKTHMQYKHVARYPCKYIYIVRDCRDVAVSFYHHQVKLMGFKGEFGQFMDKVFLKQGHGGCTWFKHVHDWYRNPQKRDILYLRYEDMKKDLPGVIRRVMDFCGLQADEAVFRRVLERSSFTFMKQHEKKFDPGNEILLTTMMNAGSFLRKGQVGGWREYFKEKHLEQCQELYGRWISGKIDLPYNL